MRRATGERGAVAALSTLVAPARPREYWLRKVRSIKSWEAGGRRAPHKPLLLLYALGHLQRTRQAAVPFAEAERPLKDLLREYSPTGSALHPEYPFYYLQNDGLWQINPPITPAPGRSPSAAQMRVADVVGSLPPGMVGALQRNPLLFGAIVRHLLDHNFEPSLHEDICAMAGLDLKALQIGPPLATTRAPAFRDAVLAAYEYQCAVCGFEGRIKSQAVGLEAAHVRWWASGGPDAVENSLCLCSLHHKLLDTGVLGLTDDHCVLVSIYFVARSEVGQRMVLDFTGRSLLAPQRGQPRVLAEYITWHSSQVFKAPARVA